MTEARDKQAARRAAYAWVYNLMRENEWPGATQEQVEALWVIADAFKFASEINDPDLSALEDGEPIPGKCQDKDCTGPHMLPERRRKR